MNPLNPQELAALQHLHQRAAASGQAMVGPGMQATLTPPSTEERIIEGVPFYETPIHEPKPWLPWSKTIAWGLNDRVVSFTNEAINTTAVQRVGFDVPAVVYGITAAVRSTAGAAIAGSFGTVLDTFSIQFRLSQGRLWQTNQGLGSTVCGTAERPRFLGRPCWRFSGNSVLILNLTPLVANMQYDINLWTLETYGASNIMPTL